MEFYNSIAPIIFSDDPSAVPTYLVDCTLLPDAVTAYTATNPCNSVLDQRKTPQTVLVSDASMVTAPKD